MKLSDILLLLKGKRAAVGEIRNWKGGSYIKTATGWKPHEKQYSKKFVERKNNAAGKKEADLKKRQSEVARLSGEIQGHKAAVEHHTKQGTKQDERQAKYHAIRAQVKQRRLDKHKEILEQRHGVKDEVKGIEKVDPVKNPEKFKSDFIAELKKQTNNSQPESWYEYQAKVNLENAINITKRNNEEPKKQTPVKSPEAKANFEKWKAERQGKEKTTSSLIEDFQKLKASKPTKASQIIPLLETSKNISGNNSLGIISGEALDALTANLDLSELNKLKETLKGYNSRHIDRFDIANVDFRIKEKSKPTTPQEQPKPKTKEKKLSELNSYLKDRYESGHSLSDIFKELKKDYIKHQNGAEAIFGDFIKSQKESGNQKLMDEFNRTSFIENINPAKPKTDVIQAGNRGATIAGQHYTKREVDILNSLDSIIERAKSPAVQDLLKKRQTAKPTPKTSNLEPHESKFMELVKRNRSQADKQAGYPEERRKIEAETGVKIPKEKAVEMTKHMKASFIWDIKKPLFFR